MKYLPDQFPVTPWVLTLAPPIIKAATEKKFPGKVLLSGMLYGMALAILSNVIPDLSATLAWVIAITSILINGEQFFATLSTWIG